jgi:hypothetical protein
MKTSYPLQAFIKDKSGSSAEFILRCRKVASLFSNVSMEAVFWNRAGYAIVDSHASYGCQRNLGQDESFEVEESFLNFYAFCFNVPAVCWEDYSYLMWRLSGPSELDIFQKHLRILQGQEDADRIDGVASSANHAVLPPKTEAAEERAKAFAVPDSLAGVPLTKIYKMAESYQRIRRPLEKWKIIKPLRVLGRLLMRKRVTRPPNDQ